MAFTKINAAGIGTTETVTVDGLTVINNGSFGGNLTVSGVLTYEDVTNVDSVGLITARNGIVVGSGITLSKDGDIFATGITTVSGNVKVGTGITLSPDGDGFYTGVVTATSFSGSGANLTGIDTDLVSDTSPQLGGDLDTNDHHILLDQNHYLYFVTNGGSSFLGKTASGLYLQNNGDLHLRGDDVYIRGDDNSKMGKFIEGGAVELYHNDSKKFETTTTGVKISGSGVTYLEINSTDGSVNPMVRQTNGDQTFDTGLRGDSSDNWCIYDVTNSDNRFMLDPSGNVRIPNDNVEFSVGAGNDLVLKHDGNHSYLDNGTGNLYVNAPNYFQLGVSNGGDKYLTATENGALELYYDNDLSAKTVTDGIQLQTDKFISRHPNSNTQIIEVTNAQYAKSIYFGGWDGGTNSAGVSRVRNSNDNLHLDAGSGGSLYLMAYSDNVTFCRHFRPMSNDLYDLGGNGIRWDDVFATNGTINTSDRTLKNTIVDSDLGLSFINKLKPVSYKFNGKTRTHYGLIAQDVETVLSDISKPSTDFAGFIKTDLPDEYYQEAEPHIPEGKKEGDLKSAAHTEYGLRYTEFISPLIKAVQELSAKNDALEARIAALEG